MPWRSVAQACLRTISGGTHPTVYVLLMSESGGTVSGEGLWCNETSDFEEEPIARALPHIAHLLSRSLSHSLTCLCRYCRLQEFRQRFRAISAMGKWWRSKA